MRRIVTSAVVLAVLAAAAAFFLLRDDGSEPASTANDQSERYLKSGPARLEAGGGRTEAATADGQSQKPEAPVSARTRYRGPLHVHGRVLAPVDVGFGPDARVHVVVVEGDPKGSVLARAPLDAFGAFNFHAKTDAGVSRVRVVASIPGFVTATADAEPAADGDVAVDIPLADELKRGWTCAARIVDAAGMPIAGLPVFVEASGYEGTCIPLARLDPGLVIGAGDNGVAQGLRGTGITDADGRFTVRGLLCGGCTRARSGSSDWFLLEDVANQTLAFDRDKGERTLTAWRAATLHLTVVEEGTGKPVDRFVVRAVPEGGAPWTWQGRDGRLDVSWPRSPASERIALDLSVDCQPDFWPESSLYAATEGKTVIDANVVLRRVTPKNSGRVAVRVSGRGASLVGREPQALVITLRRPGHRSVGIELRVSISSSDRVVAGVAAGPFDIAEGEWAYEIQPSVTRASLLTGRGSLVVAPGRDAEIVWEIPSFGTLVVGGHAVSEGSDGKSAVLRSAADGRELRASLSEMLLVPVGGWTVTILDTGGKVLGTATATIEEGKETVAHIGGE